MATQLLTSAWAPENFYETTLSADCTDVDTDIFLTGVPTNTEGTLVIDPDSATNREIIYYSSKTGTKVVCPANGRGYDGSTASSHTSGTKVIMAPIADWYNSLKKGDIIEGLATRINETMFDHVASGCVWSGDAYGSTRVASMTSGVVYIGGVRVTVSAVTSRTFTASKDTYIDIDSAGTIYYTEVSNNAASPSTTTVGSISRTGGALVCLGIIVTGASNIANVGSVNQGQTDRILPIASSIAYSVTDSLGNLICPRDPLRKVIGYRQITAGVSTTGTAQNDVPGLNVVVDVPDGRRIKVTVFAQETRSSQAAGGVTFITIIEDGANKAESRYNTPVSGYGVCPPCIYLGNPASGAHTYKASYYQQFAGTINFDATSTCPAFILVELV